MSDTIRPMLQYKEMARCRSLVTLFNQDPRTPFDSEAITGHEQYDWTVKNTYRRVCEAIYENGLAGVPDVYIVYKKEIKDISFEQENPQIFIDSKTRLIEITYKAIVWQVEA